MQRLVFTVAAILASCLVSFSYADTLSTGTYSTGTGSDGNQTTPLGPTGPWTLTATDTTFSYLLRSVDQTFTFGELTNLNTVFSTNPNGSPPDTGAGGGSPRLRVQLDDTVDGRGIHSVSVYLGDPPNYTGTPTALDSYSGVNFIGNSDNGRYDTSEFAGGNTYTDYSNTLSLLGNATVLRLGLVEDTFGTVGDKNITVDSINASFAAPVPLPSSVWGGVGLLGLIGLMKLRRRKMAV